MEVVEAYQLANELLREHGLKERDNYWTFDLSNHKRFLGMCYYREKKIVFSKYFLNSPDKVVYDTILHEIAHALVGPEMGHNRVWKRKAVALGIRPTSCAQPGDGVTSTAKHNYVMICPSCDRKWRRYRMRRRNFGSVCPDCKVPVKIYRIVGEEGE